MPAQDYSLKIRDVDLRATPENKGFELRVRYLGRNGEAEQRHIVADTDIGTLLEGCQTVAQQIFREEFRLNSAVELTFQLEASNGMKLWHTKPNLYVKLPLTMTMGWSCHHLSQAYKTMTTLGVIELPDETQLDGASLPPRETVRVIMDSMASGIEFMGNIMQMRENIDHDAEAKRGLHG